MITLNIKTFPLHFTEDKLDQIRKESKLRKQSIKEFINVAIDNSLANKPMKED